MPVPFVLFHFLTATGPGFPSSPAEACRFPQPSASTASLPRSWYGVVKLLQDGAHLAGILLPLNACWSQKTLAICSASGRRVSWLSLLCTDTDCQWASTGCSPSQGSWLCFATIQGAFCGSARLDACLGRAAWCWRDPWRRLRARLAFK